MKPRKLILILITIAAIPLGAQTADAHARKLADLYRMVALTGGEKMADQLFDVMTANMRNSAPGSEQYLDEMKKEIGGGKLIDMMVVIYDKYLSDEDVKAVIQFYESPAGKKMIDMTPKIVADMMAQSSEITARVMQRIKEKQGK